MRLQDELHHCLLLSLPLYFKLAAHLHIFFDIPAERSSQGKPTIRGGGVIFPLAVLLWFVFFGFAHPLAIAGLLMIATVSFTDDLLSIPVFAGIGTSCVSGFWNPWFCFQIILSVFAHYIE